MSLFQCDECGCVENTAMPEGYWCRHAEGEPDLCSECVSGLWHDEFRKIMLPKNKFITNREGNLEHYLTGDTDIEKCEIKQ